MRFLSLALALAIVLGASACAPERGRGLTVFAAASLSDVLPPLGERFAREAALPVDFHFAGSSSLVNQVLKGAPADVLVLAGGRPLERVRGLAYRRDVAANRLVLVSGPDFDSPGPWPASLCGEAVKHVALADPDTAPAGAYGRQSLQALGLWDCLEGRVVPSLDVRAALALARAGQAEVALVYASDARAFQDVQVLAVMPEDSHDPILYPAAVAPNSRHPEEARRFVDFLASEEGRREFEGAGFVGVSTPPRTTPAPRSPRR